jgi:toxin YoeB
MFKNWSDEAWDNYLYWQSQDRKTLKKINDLIKDIDRNGESAGIGHPEALKANLSGFWSRRIDEKNRLVYKVTDDAIDILICREHYGQ